MNITQEEIVASAIKHMRLYKEKKNKKSLDNAFNMINDAIKKKEKYNQKINTISRKDDNNG